MSRSVSAYLCSDLVDLHQHERSVLYFSLEAIAQLATFDRPSLDLGFASDKSEVLDSVGMKHTNYPHYCVSVPSPPPFLSFFLNAKRYVTYFQQLLRRCSRRSRVSCDMVRDVHS